MEAQAYKLFGAHELAAAREGAQDRIAAWSSAWLPAGVTAELECEPASACHQRFKAFDRAQWTRVAARSGEFVAMPSAADGARAFSEVLLGHAEAAFHPQAAGSELAAAAAGTALRGLLAALLGSQRDPAGPEYGRGIAPDQAIWNVGSAALAFRLTAGGAHVDFVCGPAWTLSLLAQRLRPAADARLTDRRTAVALQHVQLQVLAGSAEVDLRSLSAIAPGDVISLDGGVDQPMAVVVAAGARPRVCGGRLGSIEGRRSIELTGG
jgi:hypothetical protein